MQKDSFPLDASAPFFEYFFKNSKKNAIAIMDKDGFILRINEVFMHYFGYPPEHLVGRHFNILYTEEDRKTSLPEREIINVKEQGFSFDNNYILHKNGSRLWVSGESVLVKDEDNIFIVKIIQNINDQKNLEEFLLESNDFVENIFHHIKDFIVVINPEMRILKINHSFLDHLGLNKGKVEGKNLSQILNASQYQQLFDMIARVREGEVFSSIEFKLQIPGGAEHIYLLSAILMNKYQKEEKRILLILHDVTSEKMMDDQREEVIGFVSHELKNPLTSISLYAELVRDQLENGQKKVLMPLEKIIANVGYVQTIIDDLYDISKAGAGHLKIKKENFVFEEAVSDALNTFEISHPGYRIKRKGRANVEILGDRLRLAQVLTNYFNNAVKYAPDAHEIILDIKLRDGEINVGITDFGIGISEEKMPYVFNKYYRVGKLLKAEGTGLGLYVVKKIITAHQGKVWAESEEGKGSTFYFSLPARPLKS